MGGAVTSGRAGTSTSVCSSVFWRSSAISGRSYQERRPVTRTNRGTGVPPAPRAPRAAARSRCSGLVHLNLDLLGLGLFPQRETHREDPVLVLSGDRPGVDGGRQSERPAEGAVRPLDAVVLLLLDLGVHFPLPADGQGVVLDAQ